MRRKSWGELTGSGNPENGDYAAGLEPDTAPVEIPTWMGVDIRTLPTEKLCEIIEHLGRDLAETRHDLSFMSWLLEIVAKRKR